LAESKALHHKKNKKRSVFRILKYLLFCYLIYFLAGVLVPPLFHQSVSQETMKEIQNARDSQEAKESQKAGKNQLQQESQEAGKNQLEQKSQEAGQNPADSQFDQGEKPQERVLCVDDNREALLWRLRMIASAKRELTLATFDLREDNSGIDILAALYEAADRGVHVNLLVDGISGSLRLKQSANVQALAALDNVEVRFYNPVNFLTPWKLNYRMHDKYLIVDDTAYLLGGRNTYDLFLGEYVSSYNIDRDVLVYEKEAGENSSLNELQSYFETIWESGYCQSLSGGSGRRVQTAAEELYAHARTLRQQYPESYETFDWETETLPADSVGLLSNPSSPSNKQPQLWESLVTWMKGGHDILVQTPYIICNGRMYEELKEVCESGSTLQIMTNAVENGANPFGCSDYLNQKSRILDTGAGVAEWMGGQSLHTKTILIDDSISIIGSFNMDMRSAYLDTELMLVIDCPELNQMLRSSYEEMKEACRVVAPDGSEQLPEQVEMVEQTWKEKCFYQILRVVMRPFRYLL
jgi:phosphatidylserine/phosphatidylglycerophosphate/cardiolipin synthase-like enzyme